MNFFRIAETTVSVLFFILYAYQFFYLAAALLVRKRKKPARETGETPRIAVLIAARNEECVIGELLSSLAAQDYPHDRFSVFVGADNCDDRTAVYARAHGAFVYERTDTVHTGKGYVLDFLIRNLDRDFGRSHFDAYVVLDADNVLTPGFLSALVREKNEGYDVVTCYRNAKNYGDSWVSSAYGLWFLRTSVYLNGARKLLSVNTAVSGTGFLFTDRVLRMAGGWCFHTLTEDAEFTAFCALCGIRSGYARDAVLFDEQPVFVSVSFRQRLRWARGFLEVITRYGGNLFSALPYSFSCYDVTANLFPAAILTWTGILLRIAEIPVSIAAGVTVWEAFLPLLSCLAGIWTGAFFMGCITLLTEWKEICAPAKKKLCSAFTFPLFILTSLPISAAALFYNPGWKPIRHTRSMCLSEIGAQIKK